MTPGEWRRVVRQLAIVAGAWTVPALIGIAGYSFGRIAGAGTAMRASHYVAHSFALWYSWIPATPVIFWMHRRRAPVWRAFLEHAATLGAVIALQSWLTVAVARFTGHALGQAGVRQNLTFGIANLLPYDALVYAGVVAAAIGLEYARRYRDRDLRASQLETQLARARLESLQMQLQPHFLFNSLNAIAMLIRCDRKEEAVGTVVGVGELLRYVLEESGTLDVALADELRFVRRYLDIARVRLGDSLHVSIDVDRDAGAAVIPNLLLQPVVENALKHGVGSGGGHVSIRCERRGRRLRVEVEDDGPGLPAGFDVALTDGIGLRNLRQRINALCGDDGSLTIGSRRGGGTSAVIEIPFRHARADAPEPTLAGAS